MSLTAPGGLDGRPTSLWNQTLRRLCRHPGARLGFAVLLALATLAGLADRVGTGDPNGFDPAALFLPPLREGHLLGTDDLGRDVMTRVMHGARTSLRVGFVSVALAVTAGALIGFTAGFRGRWWDALSMRLMDLLLAFPTILLAIGIVAMRGPGLANTLLAVAVVRVPIYARVSRASALEIREREFVTAARGLGAADARLLARHVVPNALSPLVVQATLGVATAIIDAAALGFLGLGAQPPDVEWGAMLVDSIRYLFQGLWWALLFPGLAIMLTVIAFNLVGDGLRDALDVRLRA